ncbi:hypothetical protein [Acinetobacter phage HFM1]|nr:hypothetical protein [Acinetobacter phage HFM1]
MLIKIAENTMVNINEIEHVYENVMFLKSGASFRIDDIVMRNLQKICQTNEAVFFNQLNVEIK